MIYRDVAVARWSRKANSNYVEYPIADLWGRSHKCTSGSLPFSLMHVSSLHVGPATLPTTIRHSIYIWIKLLHAIPDGLRGNREPREVSIE